MATSNYKNDLTLNNQPPKSGASAALYTKLQKEGAEKNYIKPTKPAPALIKLTESAKKEILNMLEGKEGALGLRVALKTKGCSGLSWELEIAYNDNNFDDKVKINDNLIIFIDKKATLFLLGTELDYVETDLESGFVFNNPKEKGKCGCGESFYV